MSKRTVYIALKGNNYHPSDGLVYTLTNPFVDFSQGILTITAKEKTIVVPVENFEYYTITESEDE